MKNKDKYKNKIIDRLFDKDSNCDFIEELVYNGNCNHMECFDCKAHIKEWWDSEYIEKPKLTQLERDFLKSLDFDKYKWIARNQDGLLVLSFDKPYKLPQPLGELETWTISVDNEFSTIRLKDGLFNFIKYDDRPFNIKELLND